MGWTYLFSILKIIWAPFSLLYERFPYSSIAPGKLYSSSWAANWHFPTNMAMITLQDSGKLSKTLHPMEHHARQPHAMVTILFFVQFNSSIYTKEIFYWSIFFWYNILTKGHKIGLFFKYNNQNIMSNIKILL